MTIKSTIATGVGANPDGSSIGPVRIGSTLLVNFGQQWFYSVDDGTTWLAGTGGSLSPVGVVVNNAGSPVHFSTVNMQTAAVPPTSQTVETIPTAGAGGSFDLRSSGQGVGVIPGALLKSGQNSYRQTAYTLRTAPGSWSTGIAISPGDAKNYDPLMTLVLGDRVYLFSLVTASLKYVYACVLSATNARSPSSQITSFVPGAGGGLADISRPIAADTTTGYFQAGSQIFRVTAADTVAIVDDGATPYASNTAGCQMYRSQMAADPTTGDVYIVMVGPDTTALRLWWGVKPAGGTWSAPTMLEDLSAYGNNVSVLGALVFTRSDGARVLGYVWDPGGLGNFNANYGEMLLSPPTGAPQPYRAPLRLHPRSDARLWPPSGSAQASGRTFGGYY